MGPIWGRQDPGGPHVGPMNFAIWVAFILLPAFFSPFVKRHQLNLLYVMLISKSTEFVRQIVCIYFYYIISILYNFRLYCLIFIEIVLQFAWNTLSAGNNFAFTLFLQISKCITSWKITAYAVECNYRVSNLYLWTSISSFNVNVSGCGPDEFS